MKRGFRGSPRFNDLIEVGRRTTVCTALCALLALAAGCASMNQRCSFYPDGRLETYRLRSTVVGTGETELVSTDCAVAAYSTKDTGLSDNGRAAVTDVADVVSQNLRPGGQLEGKIGELIPW